MRVRRPASSAVALLVLVLVVLAGCGSDDDPSTVAASSTTSSVAEPGSRSDAEGATVAIGDTSLGEVLVDGEGMTLYLFTKDAAGKSVCAGACADTWPALTVDGDPEAGAGVEEGDLGTITRDDGTTQVTYHGKPLYRYAGDSEPGDVSGHEVGKVWFAVRADGEAAGSAAPRPGY